MNMGATGVAVLVASAGMALASGPDVTLQDIPDITNYGQVGGIYAFAIGSSTCNIGNLNLQWLSAGTPGLAMNAYRLYDGRLIQVGLGNCKTACCAAAGAGCGTCNGAGGSVLGAGCRDVYGGGFNGGQSHLGPRSVINGFSGAFTSYPQTTGNAIYRRLQVSANDLNPALFPGALYFVEGVYVGSDDAANSNGLNNATYKRATVSGGNMAVVAGSQQSGIPAIRAWRDHGLGAGVPDLSVTVATADVLGEGQFWYAFKARDLGNGQWRYDYAVFNLNSDRSGASFSVPIPAGVIVSNLGFSAPLYHSGEVYSNAPWTASAASGPVMWSSPDTFASNPNGAALRWGTMYNFWFDANAAPAPTPAAATLALFKPFSPDRVFFGVQAPGIPPCYANCDASTSPPVLNTSDFACFINRFAAGDPAANCDASTTPPRLNVLDFHCFLNAFASGCP